MGERISSAAFVCCREFVRPIVLRMPVVGKRSCPEVEAMRTAPTKSNVATHDSHSKGKYSSGIRDGSIARRCAQKNTWSHWSKRIPAPDLAGKALALSKIMATSAIRIVFLRRHAANDRTTILLDKLLQRSADCVLEPIRDIDRPGDR